MPLKATINRDSKKQNKGKTKAKQPLHVLLFFGCKNACRSLPTKRRVVLWLQTRMHIVMEWGAVVTGCKHPLLPGRTKTSYSVCAKRQAAQQLLNY